MLFVIHEVGRSRSDGAAFSLNSARPSARIVFFVIADLVGKIVVTGNGRDSI